MSTPIAVLISDVHYSVHTLELADKAMRMAISKANQLCVPLIVAGDAHDTKANLRGECVNAMCLTFSKLNADLECFILIGNHDKINEKSEEHSLNFLSNYANVVDQYRYDADLNLHLFPYYSNPKDFIRQRSILPSGEIMICHQGIQGRNMGDYIQDKSAISMEDIQGLIVHSGHYHTRDDIYIGNPYTLSWGEANDPEKGFKVLYRDGTTKFMPTNLRKHAIITISNGGIIHKTGNLAKDDLVWVKSMSNHTREEIKDILGLNSFKLTYEFSNKEIRQLSATHSPADILDSIIDNMNTDQSQKDRLKNKWKQLL